MIERLLVPCQCRPPIIIHWHSLQRLGGHWSNSDRSRLTGFILWFLHDFLLAPGKQTSVNVKPCLNVLQRRNHSPLLSYNVRIPGICVVSGCEVRLSKELMDSQKTEWIGRRDISASNGVTFHILLHTGKRDSPDSHGHMSISLTASHFNLCSPQIDCKLNVCRNRLVDHVTYVANDRAAFRVRDQARFFDLSSKGLPAI